MNEIKTEALCGIGDGQAIVGASLRCSGSIIRVLSASATCAVAPGEAFSGEVRYSGVVNFKCVVLTENGCEAVNGSSEFSDKVEVKGNGQGAILTCRVADVGVDGVNGDEVTLSAAVDVCALGNCCETLQNVSGCDEDIIVRRENVDYMTLVCKKNDSEVVKDSVPTDGTEVVSYTAKACVTGARAGAGEVTVEGKINCFAVVKNADGQLSQCKLSTPFKKIVACEGAEENDTANFAVCLASTSCEFVAGDNALDFEYSLIFDICVYRAAQAELITDAFCTTNELGTECGEFTVKTMLPIFSFEDVAEGNITLESDRAAADAVLCAPVRSVEISRATPGAKTLVEGVACGDIVYFNSEHNETHSIPFELPFSFEEPSPFEDGDDIKVDACVSDVTVKIRRESIFDLKVSIVFTITANRERKVNSLTKIDRGDKTDEGGGVCIHVAAKGESIWDAAKNMRIPPEILLKNNPELKEECEGGERIIVYKQLKK